MSVDFKFLDEWLRHPNTGDRVLADGDTPILDPIGGYQGPLPLLVNADEWTKNADRTALEQTWTVPYNSVNRINGNPNYFVFPNPGQRHPIFNWLQVAEYKVTPLRGNSMLARVVQVSEKVDPEPEAADPNDPFSDPAIPGGDAPGGGINPDQCPPNSVSIDASPQRLDIRKHPLFCTNNAAWGGRSMSDLWVVGKGGFNFEGSKEAIQSDAGLARAVEDLNGGSNYVVGGLSVTTRTYSNTDPSAIALASLIGDLTAPPGESGASGHWLIVSAGATQQNGCWCTEITYLYSERKFPAWLHG